MKYELAILIPARNEEFLKRTVEDILEHKEGKTEILVGLDGYFTDLPQHPDVRVLHKEQSIGQRAMTNRLCEMTEAKYVMKVDAHCAFDQGFDRKLLEKMEDSWTMVPVMRNLHAFDWVCEEGHRRYQSPSGVCKVCGKKTTKDVVWIGKPNPQSTSYCFDEEPHFQYFNEFKKRPEGKGEITETMSLQGSCFLLTREKYWELNICDEKFGSWGSQGIEVACKTWLSGGRVVVNHNTWYAHMFRTQGGDFGFPYENPGSKVQAAKKTARELFFDNKWDKQVRPLSWLVEKFWPVPGWSEAMRQKIKAWPIPGKSKGILYYSDNQLNMKLARAVRKQLEKSGLPITSVTLKPTEFGNNIHYKGERSYLTMFKQILTGLEAMKEDIVFFTEHDVFYHPSHFDFTPADRNTFYYNGNYWFVRQADGFAIHYDVSPLSGLVVYREAAIKHFKERIEFIEKMDWKKFGIHYVGFEPFTHKRIPWKFWCNFEIFMSEQPNVDVTHSNNNTWKRWNKKDFRKKPKFWEEGNVKDLWVKDLL